MGMRLKKRISKVRYSLYKFTSRSRGGGGGKCTLFLPKTYFFPGGMPPDPLSYNMSDVNPHLTQCEPPTGDFRPQHSFPGKISRSTDICVIKLDIFSLDLMVCNCLDIT